MTYSNFQQLTNRHFALLPHVIHCLSACYLAQSLPPTLDMIAKYARQTSDATCWQALLANANVGGENVHRGAILGAILGALAGDDSLPSEMKDGLYDRENLQREIDEFIESILNKTPNVKKEL
jgi:ADP-ribosyl-[dinitrogen reductase] hydrolase